jgi:hypothetical protein
MWEVVWSYSTRHLFPTTCHLGFSGLCTLDHLLKKVQFVLFGSGYGSEVGSGRWYGLIVKDTFSLPPATWGFHMHSSGVLPVQAAAPSPCPGCSLLPHAQAPASSPRTGISLCSCTGSASTARPGRGRHPVHGWCALACMGGVHWVACIGWRAWACVASMGVRTARLEQGCNRQ